MATVDDARGILYPTRLPSFHREAPPPELTDRVRWFWLPRWHLAPGRTTRQEVLPFPAANLVIEPSGVSLCGPTSRASHRDLRGRGWAVGALLRPAALASLCEEPRSIRDREVAFRAPDLHRAVVAAMDDDDGTAGRRRAVLAFAQWVSQAVPPPDSAGQLANTMEELVAADRSIVQVHQLAERLGVSARRVQRLAERHVGLPPLAVIRRYRLQEAAVRLREDATVTIAQVAADLGYADQAHLCADFRSVLGLRPSIYRRDPVHATGNAPAAPAVVRRTIGP